MAPPDGDVGGFEVRVLGPVEVILDGRIVSIGSLKQRAILALLALNAGRVVTAAQLCELLWNDDQPAAPIPTLQSLISRLRRALAAAGDVLVTREPGWVLDIDPAAVDALRFETVVGGARPRTASELTSALDLWRGPALVDVVEAGYLVAQATRLDDLRLRAVEDLAEAELAAGRAREALDRLEPHVDAHPLRERAWGLLMVALYRLGRQADALAAFQRVRSLLRDELGLAPSPELAAIEQRILRQDLELSGTAREPVGEFAAYSVVVVEDHDFQRRTMIQLLRSLGVSTVHEAADGGAALKLLQDIATPDVIICDIDMPGMDGVEFVSEVAQRNLACSLVIASGLEAKVLRAVEAIGESQGLQVLAAIEKPVTARRLGEALRRYTPLEATDASKAEVSDAVQFAPRIDLTTGAFSSAEAFGHGVGVDRIVADACEMLDIASDAGLQIRVSVDVSSLPLSDSSLADRLAEMVRARNHDPHEFVFVVADVTLARATAPALSVLTRLRVKGFGLAMSNCGAGPSWAHQLDRVPLSELKLDPRLVSGVSDDPKRLAALEAALSAIHETKLPVVADGCDSQADFDALLALGCSEVQGRCVAAPMGGEEVVDWALAGGGQMA